jgi:hypothetical protein
MPNGTGTVSSLRDLIALAGPKEVTELIQGLPDADAALVVAGLLRHDGDPVAALGGTHLPADVQAEIRRVYR